MADPLEWNVDSAAASRAAETWQLREELSAQNQAMKMVQAELRASESEGDRLRAELAAAHPLNERLAKSLSALAADNAAKDARIAESDKMVADLETECIEKDRLTADMLESRNARIAELEAAIRAFMHAQTNQHWAAAGAKARALLPKLDED